MASFQPGYDVSLPEGTQMIRIYHHKMKMLWGHLVFPQNSAKPNGRIRQLTSYHTPGASVYLRELTANLSTHTKLIETKMGRVTLQGTNISPQTWHFEDDFPFPQVGYVGSQEGMKTQIYQKHTYIYIYTFRLNIKIWWTGPQTLFLTCLWGGCSAWQYLHKISLQAGFLEGWNTLVEDTGGFPIEEVSVKRTREKKDRKKSSTWRCCSISGQIPATSNV